MRIKCPECSQKFEVSEDFVGKTVECGSCDQRFKVSDDTIIEEKKKFYPGEKRDKVLDSFGKNTASLNAPVSFQQAQYQKGIDADLVGPPRPRRTLATIVGVMLLIGVILFFLLAGGKEGAMRDMVTSNRFVFTGFMALIGGGLMLYGTTHSKKVGWLAAIILCGIVISLPKFFPGNPTSSKVIDHGEEIETSVISEKTEEQVMEDYLLEIGYDPIKKNIAGSNPNSVVGVYLRNAAEPVRAKIAAYLYNATGRVSRETSYDRGTAGLNGLILLIEQKKTIDEIASMCEKFGSIEKISREYRIIDVAVVHHKVESLNGDIALNSSNVNFERENLKAMRGIDPSVQINAVKRLANSEPKALRPDITAQMLSMLPSANNELKVELIRALKVWSQPDDGSEQAVLKAVQELHKEGLADKAGIEFLIEREMDDVAVILMELWKKDPVSWSETLAGLGEGAEVLILPILSNLNDSQVVVATEILGKVGTKAGILVIQEAMEKSKSDVAKKSMQAAIDEIKNRS